MSVWLVFYHGGSAFHCESFLLGANYLTVLVTAHKALSLLTGIEEGPLAFELFWKSSNDKVHLADVIDEEHETALELRPAAAQDDEKVCEKVEEHQNVENEEQQEEKELEEVEQLETPAKKSKQKTAASRKKRDPNAPKRPKTAYQLFCNDNRAKVRFEHGALSLGEVSTKLAELWKQITAETKQEYEGKAAPGKAQYEKEKKEYDERHNDYDTPQKEQQRDGGDDFVDTTERLARKRLRAFDAGEQV
jgi:hypothetical protein